LYGDPPLLKIPGCVPDYLPDIVFLIRINYSLSSYLRCVCSFIVDGGNNGRGEQSNQFYDPRSLSFDREGNLYVADCKKWLSTKIWNQIKYNEFIRDGRNSSHSLIHTSHFFRSVIDARYP
jgi:hypothetical protein